MKNDLKNGTVIVVDEDRPLRPSSPTADRLAATGAPPKRPRGLNRMRVVKIDPAKRIAAIITIKADMKTVRTLVDRHVAEQLVTEVGGIHIRVCCATIGKGEIWKVRGSLPVRGRAILYGFAGHGPSDFPADTAWVKRMIAFDVPDEKAINDKREDKTDGEV